MKLVFLALVLVTGAIAGVTQRDSNQSKKVNLDNNLNVQEIQAELAEVHKQDLDLHQKKTFLTNQLHEVQKKVAQKQKSRPPITEQQSNDPPEVLGETDEPKELEGQEAETQDQDQLPQQEETVPDYNNQGSSDPAPQVPNLMPETENGSENEGISENQSGSDPLEGIIDENQQIPNDNEEPNGSSGLGVDLNINESNDQEELKTPVGKIQTTKPVGGDIVDKLKNGEQPKNLAKKPQPVKSTNKAVNPNNLKIQSNIDPNKNSEKNLISNLQKNANKNLKQLAKKVQPPQPQQGDYVDTSDALSDGGNAEVSPQLGDVDNQETYGSYGNPAENSGFSVDSRSNVPSNEQLNNLKNKVQPPKLFKNAEDNLYKATLKNNQNTGLKVNVPQEKLNNLKKSAPSSKPYLDQGRNLINQAANENNLGVQIQTSDPNNRRVLSTNNPNQNAGKNLKNNFNDAVQKVSNGINSPVVTYDGSTNPGNGKGSVQIPQVRLPLQNQENVNLRRPQPSVGLQLPGMKFNGNPGGLIPSIDFGVNNQGGPGFNLNGENGQLSINGNSGGPKFGLNLNNQGGPGFNLHGGNGQLSINGNSGGPKFGLNLNNQGGPGFNLHGGKGQLSFNGNPGVIIPDPNLGLSNYGNQNLYLDGGNGQLSFDANGGVPHYDVPAYGSNPTYVQYGDNSGMYSDGGDGQLSFNVAGEVDPGYVISPQDSSYVSVNPQGVNTNGNSGYHLGDFSNGVVNSVGGFVKPIVDNIANIPNAMIDVGGGITNKFIDGAGNVLKTGGDTLGNVRSTLHNTRKNLQHNSRRVVRNFVNNAAGDYDNGY